MQLDPQTCSDRAQEFQLWCAYPDDLLAPEASQACLSLLSSDERARCDRYRFEKRRREHIATHALKRRALSASFPLAAQAWQFLENAHGKPSIDKEIGSECGLRFNVSNSEKLVVCLVSQGTEVGVDVEPLDRATEIAKLAERVFSPAEQAQLEVLDDVERMDRAVSLWTLKEAYIKARGMGLALPLDGFSFLFGGAEGVRLEVDTALKDNAGRWRFCLFDHAGHRIAMMVDGRPGELHVWEARSVLGTPLHVHSCGVSWFPR